MSPEDVLVYLALCPALFLYVAIHRFPLIYAVPYLYVAWRFYYEWKAGRNPWPGWKNPYLSPVLLLWGLGLVALLFPQDYLVFKVLRRDVLILTGYFLPFVYAHRFEDKHVKALFLTEVFAYLIWIDFSKYKLIIPLFFSARSVTEYDIGLFFGLFFLYFLYQKQYGWLAFSTFILLLVAKRVVYLGVIPAAFWLGWVSVFPAFRSRNWSIGVLVLVYLGLTLLSFFIVDGMTWYFHTYKGGNQRIDYMLNGRAYSLNFIIFKIMDSDLFRFVFGHGPGQLDVQISLFRPVHWSKYFPDPTNPHNDFLKIFYDYGLLGYLAFGYFLIRLYWKRVLGVMFLLFTFFLFFLDNPLIHIYFNLIALVLLHTREAHEE
jgi:hypothetical protein